MLERRLYPLPRVVYLIAGVGLAALLGVLAVVAPEFGMFIGTVMLLVLCAWRAETLLMAVLVFALVSTLPGISMAAEIIEIQVLPSVAVNFIGLVRTLLAALVVVRVSMLVRERWPLVWRKGLFFLALWGYAVLSLAWSPRWALGEGLRLLVHFSLAFGVYFLALHTAMQEARRIRLLGGIFLLAVVVAAGSLISFRFLPEETSLGITDLDRGERLTGLAASPNILAGNLAIFIGLSVASLLTPRLQRAWRQAAMLVLVLSSISLALTFSRSGWIGAGLAVILALTLRRKWLWLVVLGCLGVALLFGSSAGNRFLGDWQVAFSGANWATTRGYQNAYGRLEFLWRPALEQLTTPVGIVLGRGAGTAQAWAFGYFGSGLHSEFLQIWLDFGSLGVGLTVLGFGGVLRLAYRLFRTALEPAGQALGLGSLCVSAALLPQFLWQHVFNGPNVWLLLMIWGLTSGAEQWTGRPALITRRSPPGHDASA